MKTKAKIKIFFESKVVRVVISILAVIVLLLAIILPSALTSRPKGSVIAFNRDASSGTREAFVKKVLDVDDDLWTPGSNVREVRNNDAMITFVQREKNSVGYVSFGTVAQFNEVDKQTPELKERPGAENISFTTFENVIPTKANIETGEYKAARNFNMFFRVESGSDEYSITGYDWDANTLGDVNLATINSVNNANDLKAAYLFFSWVTRSQEAFDVIEESGEIPYSSVIEGIGSTRNNWFAPEADWANTPIDQYVNNMEVENDIVIEIVGSTSCTSVMNELTHEFDRVVSDAYGLDEKDLEFVLVTNGSGDAVKDVIPGADHPFIGMQSKDGAFDGEFGYTMEADADPANGIEAYDTNVYTSFAIDAILMIYNNENDFVSDYNEAELNVNRDDVVMLYTDKNVLEKLNEAEPSEELVNIINNYKEYIYYEDLFTEYDPSAREVVE